MMMPFPMQLVQMSDICVALGFPLALYSGLEVMKGGEGTIFLAVANAGEAAASAGQGGVQDLRIVLIILSVIIVGMFLMAPKDKDEEGNTQLLIGKGHGFALIGMYALWTGYVVSQIIG